MSFYTKFDQTFGSGYGYTAPQQANIFSQKDRTNHHTSIDENAEQLKHLTDILSERYIGYVEKKPSLLEKGKYQTIQSLTIKVTSTGECKKIKIYVKIEELSQKLGVSKSALKKVGKEDFEWKNLLLANKKLKEIVRARDNTTIESFREFEKTIENANLVSELVYLVTHLENDPTKKENNLISLVANYPKFKEKKWQATLLEISKSVRFNVLEKTTFRDLSDYKAPSAPPAVEAYYIKKDKNHMGYYFVRKPNKTYEVYIEEESNRLLKLNDGSVTNVETLQRKLGKNKIIPR
jgi:hypothetical protein